MCEMSIERKCEEEKATEEEKEEKEEKAAGAELKTKTPHNDVGKNWGKRSISEKIPIDTFGYRPHIRTPVD